MSEITKPIALDESLHTTEQTPRNIADVLADELQNLATAISGGSDKAPKTDIATVEPTNTASRAYSVGELVYVNGNLYKVITAIASGATFTVGTNIQSTNVSGTVKDALDNMSAENVSYGSGTVKDALDELNSSNSDGTITLTTTPYETEADGYVWVYMSNPNHTYSVRVKSNDDTVIAYLRGQSSIEYEYHSLYVKKGMKIVCDPQQSLTDGDTVWFMPLTD